MKVGAGFAGDTNIKTRSPQTMKTQPVVKQGRNGRCGDYIKILEQTEKQL